MVFERRLKILNVHTSKQEFFPTSRQVINKIKIHYLYSSTIRTSNLFFGCFLTFSFQTSVQNFPTITYSRAVTAPTFSPIPLYLCSENILTKREGKKIGNCRLAKTNTIFIHQSTGARRYMYAYAPDKFENTHIHIQNFGGG